MFNLAEHLTKARKQPDLRPDVGFRLVPEFFYGSQRKPQPNDLRTQTVPLPVPGFVERRTVWVSAVKRPQDRQELLRYYQAVLRVAQQHRKDANATGHYFWLRPELRGSGGAVVTFPWYDTYPETAQLLQALQLPGDNQELLHDIEQGWQLGIYATADEVFIGQGTADDDKPQAVYRTNRARLASLAATVLVQTRELLAYLVQETGHNPWSYRP